MNKLLLPNENKPGSYTIVVKKDYAVPKEDLRRVIDRLLKR